MAQEQTEGTNLGSSEVVFFRYSVGNIHRIEMRPVSIEFSSEYRAIRVDFIKLVSKLKVHFCAVKVREAGTFRCRVAQRTFSTM